MAKYEPQDERLQEVLLQELVELPRCIVCRVSCACRADGQLVPDLEALGFVGCRGPRTYVGEVPEELLDVVEGGLDVFGTLVVGLLRHRLLVDHHAEPGQRVVEEQRKQIAWSPPQAFASVEWC